MTRKGIGPPVEMTRKGIGPPVEMTRKGIGPPVERIKTGNRPSDGMTNARGARPEMTGRQEELIRDGAGLR
jgi:hypothetical protein